MQKQRYIATCMSDGKSITFSVKAKRHKQAINKTKVFIYEKGIIAENAQCIVTAMPSDAAPTNRKGVDYEIPDDEIEFEEDVHMEQFAS